MYELNDTIVAVSSPTAGERAIVRITGPSTIDIVARIFSPYTRDKAGLVSGSIAVDAELKVDAKLYMFLAPNSYTGDDVAEIHIHANPPVTETIMGNLLGNTGTPVRMAGPGEFTARSFLNGKINLAQAEAVNEIVLSCNKFQLAASEKLLAGRLAETTTKVRSELIDCISLIEAGLDFSGEDIEFITGPEAVERLTQIKNELEWLLSASIRYEQVVDLPAVGIAGAPNAGKSSLLNKLLGLQRSIVSHKSKTTRDVLTGLLTLKHCRCVLFDCAGLTRDSSLVTRHSRHGARGTGHEQRTILDELAQQAAIEALQNSSLVVFCTDISKEDWTQDFSIRKLIEPKMLIPIATKSDLLSEDILARRLAELDELFAAEFLATSVKTGTGVELLRETIDRTIIELSLGPAAVQSAPHQLSDDGRLAQLEGIGRGASTIGAGFSETAQKAVALTTRHRQTVTEAIENVSESINELKAGNDEVAAMMMRAAYRAISDIERQHVDEQILERIFSRFCVGK